MKVQNIRNVDKFFELIDKCEGKIELVTGEGDRINLKSKICQYIAISKIFADVNIPEIEIVAYDPEDVKKIINFMLANK